MNISIIQSCYIPWKGFFDLIGRTDIHVILDGAQYVKRHWHNRNRIMTADGPIWLTIPVATKARFEQSIEDVRFAEPWAEKHWRAIELAYRRAPFFADEAPALRTLYEQADRLSTLTEVNELFLVGLLKRLGITTRVVRDRNFEPEGKRGDRLLDICRKAGATRYLSGPSARNYLDEAPFTAAGISVDWMSYGPYPPYPQRGPAFDHAVSVIDVLFAVGPDAPAYCQSLAKVHGP